MVQIQIQEIHVAIYGAILSTLILIWNIIKIIKDRPRIKIATYCGFTTDVNLQPIAETFSFEAVNLSKKPITLVDAGIFLGGEKYIIFRPEIHKLPKKLFEGDKASFYYEVNEIRSDLIGKSPKFVWFRDTTGKTYVDRHGGTLLRKFSREESKKSTPPKIDDSS